jgi:hypothetical protein
MLSSGNIRMKNTPQTAEWLPFDIAAKRFGYQHKESLRNRLRQLRAQGFVVDTGRPPADYVPGDSTTEGKVVLLWPNPKVALIRSDAPATLLNPKRGKRARSGGGK